MWAFLAVVGLAVLVVAAGPAQAATSKPPPKELWQEYPLDPLSEHGSSVSVQSIRMPVLRTSESSSTDSTLLIAGLALVVLALSSASFLLLARRSLIRVRY